MIYFYRILESKSAREIDVSVDIVHIKYIRSRDFLDTADDHNNIVNIITKRNYHIKIIHIIV